MMMDGLYGYAQNIRFINLETIKAGDEIESGVFHHSYFFGSVLFFVVGSGGWWLSEKGTNTVLSAATVYEFSWGGFVFSLLNAHNWMFSRESTVLKYLSK